ncbi:hypothetical protein KTD31_01185 [Burkholderia multivorans]|uniref:hypothetical protein n=1 Tax=Burkholderia multivorans TaxID=87883 RepID=UPI001C230D1A|nr:hypothetical protein [Burkholderia multivorans]MBU9200016.1 hypothetical protein [Burkholderia multivorans]
MNHDNRAVEQSASEALGPAEIEVVSGMGAKRFDANSIAIAAFTEDLSKLPPAPGLLSEISDEPAIRYRTQDVTLHLTPGELQRIVMRSLTPAELFALRAAHGDFFEIHADFYDPVSGHALQPKD